MRDDIDELVPSIPKRVNSARRKTA